MRYLLAALLMIASTETRAPETHTHTHTPEVWPPHIWQDCEPLFPTDSQGCQKYT